MSSWTGLLGCIGSGAATLDCVRVLDADDEGRLEGVIGLSSIHALGGAGVLEPCPGWRATMDVHPLPAGAFAAGDGVGAGTRGRPG